jgi:hypothetical protein
MKKLFSFPSSKTFVGDPQYLNPFESRSMRVGPRDRRTIHGQKK